MKVLKNIALTVPVFLLFACSGEKKNDKTEVKNEALEVWVIKKAEGMMADANVGTEYIFDGNELTLKGSGMKNEGTFEMKSDTLVFHMKTFTGEMFYLKEMKGKQMILKPVGSDQIFYLEKK